jgi:hypothetical protein
MNSACLILSSRVVPMRLVQMCCERSGRCDSTFEIRLRLCQPTAITGSPQSRPRPPSLPKMIMRHFRRFSLRQTEMGISLRSIPILRRKLESRSALADFEAAKTEPSRRITSEMGKSHMCSYSFAKLAHAKVMVGARFGSPQCNVACAPDSRFPRVRTRRFGLIMVHVQTHVD